LSGGPVFKDQGWRIQPCKRPTTDSIVQYAHTAQRALHSSTASTPLKTMWITHGRSGQV
jgi:hypothetical protein